MQAQTELALVSLVPIGRADILPARLGLTAATCIVLVAQRLPRTGPSLWNAVPYAMWWRLPQKQKLQASFTMPKSLSLSGICSNNWDTSNHQHPSKRTIQLPHHL